MPNIEMSRNHVNLDAAGSVTPDEPFIITNKRTGRRHQVERLTWSSTVSFTEDGEIQHTGYMHTSASGTNVKADGSLGAPWRTSYLSPRDFDRDARLQDLRDAADKALADEADRWIVRRNDKEK